MDGDKLRDVVKDIEIQVSMLKQQVNKLEKAVSTYQDDIVGNGGRMGIRTKVAIIWRTYVWLLCTASALCGSFLTWMFMRTMSQ